MFQRGSYTGPLFSYQRNVPRTPERSLCATLKAVGAPQGADPKESKLTGWKHYEVPTRFTWNLSAGQAHQVLMLLEVMRRGYEPKEWELRAIAHLISSATLFLEAQGATIGKVRTGYSPSEARVGADDPDGHCVCGHD